MKRRSLQSLRTPSPFTHARWNHGLMEPREIQSMNSREPTPTHPLGHDEEGRESHVEQGPDVDGDHATGRVEQTSSGSERHRGSDSPEDPATPTQGYTTDNSPENGIENNNADELRTGSGDEGQGDDEVEEYDDAQAAIPDWESESGESLYHDSQQYQMSHEDREDAFDYEHFFLHSALGRFSRQDRGASSESDFSDDSVETTRGPMSSLSRKRHSIDTTASDDTFATATEGRASRSSAFKGEMGSGYDGRYDELPPLQEVGSNDGTEGANETHETQHPQHVMLNRPMSAAKADRLHRPSISSFESTGTNRSFPLVNRAKLNGGVLTPGGSPDPMLRQMSETLMNDAAGTLGRDGAGQTAVSLQGLPKEDQIAVERLVASLGKCVLGLGETSKASTEARSLRRRIDAALRILEGQDES